MELVGKNVVFIGGFGGIGLETCKSLLKRDLANLVILDVANNSAAMADLKAINEKATIHFWTYDVTINTEDMRAIFKQILETIQTIDILVYGAGICNDHKMELTVQINLTGLVNTTSVAFDLLDKRHGGRGGVIVTIASVAGLNVFPTIPIYSATKAAVVSFTTGISRMQPLTGISAFTICPGLTRTGLLETIKTFKDLDTKICEKLVTTPMQSAEECGKNFATVIERNINGAIWILDDGKLEITELKTHWEPPAELR